MCNKQIYDVKSCKAILKEALRSNRSYRKEKRFYYCDLCKGHHMTSKEEFIPQISLLDVKLKEKWQSLLES
jgi:hypothetical protein